MRSIVSSSAVRNSAPSPGRRPSYQFLVSRASASASGRKLTQRFTRDPSTSDGLHPRGLRIPAAGRAPSSVDPAPQPPRASTRARPHVRPQKGSPTEPWRARRVHPPGVSEGPKAKETSSASIAPQVAVAGFRTYVHDPGRRRTRSDAHHAPLSGTPLQHWRPTIPTPSIGRHDGDRELHRVAALADSAAQ
jgi:hypothetical protein